VFSGTAVKPCLSRAFYRIFHEVQRESIVDDPSAANARPRDSFEARTFASALRIEAEAFAGREGLRWEHVPDIRAG